MKTRLTALAALLLAAVGCSRPQLVGIVTAKTVIPEHTVREGAMYQLGRSLIPVVSTRTVPESYQLVVEDGLGESHPVWVGKFEYERAVVGGRYSERRD